MHLVWEYQTNMNTNIFGLKISTEHEYIQFENIIRIRILFIFFNSRILLKRWNYCHQKNECINVRVFSQVAFSIRTCIFHQSIRFVPKLNLLSMKLFNWLHLSWSHKDFPLSKIRLSGASSPLPPSLGLVDMLVTGNRSSQLSGRCGWWSIGISDRTTQTLF